jgi:hypothetical protein
VNSYFLLCELGYHYDHVDVDALAVGTANVDDDPVALYWDTTTVKLVVTVVCVGLEDSPYFCIDFLYMACVACDIYFV